MNKAIGFIGDDLYIRNEDKSYSKIDSNEYISLIQEEISNWLSKNSQPLNIAKIIFIVLKKTFNVNYAFMPPGTTSVVPRNCELYNFLHDYIYNNSVYQEKIQRNAKRRDECIVGKRDFMSKNLEYYNYRISLRERLDNKDRHNGFKFYKGKH